MLIILFIKNKLIVNKFIFVLSFLLIIKVRKIRAIVIKFLNKFNFKVDIFWLSKL